MWNSENSTYRKLKYTGSFRHRLHLSFIHKLFEHLSHSSFQTLLLTSLLLPWAWWTSVPLWIIYPKCDFSIPWPPDFQTFSSAFTQLLPMVIAWLFSSFKTAHLQNLFIQSFHSLPTALSPWWFRFYHHNCFLSSSEPLHYPFLSVLSSLPHHSTWTPKQACFSKQALPYILNVPSPLSSYYIHEEKQFWFLCSLQDAKRILRKCIQLGRPLQFMFTSLN